MAAVEIGPIEGIGILGAGTAFPARELGNEEVLRNLPAALHRRGAPDDDELRFVADGIRQSLGLDRRAWAQGK